MLQRIQTIWLLLAAVAAGLTFKLSFFSGNIIAADQTKKFEALTATGNWALLILTGLLTGLILITIFLYKNRKLQIRIVLACIIVSLINLVLYYLQTKKFAEGNFDLTALLALVIPVFLILSIRGISKDEKLVKSLDRLR